jgi:hypothetical protein
LDESRRNVNNVIVKRVIKMRRPSRPRKANALSLGTFGNLNFETVPDISWHDGDVIFNGGNGFKHAFENFSNYAIGAVPGGGTKTILLGGSVNVIATYNGINKPIEIVTDGAGTDNIAVTAGDTGGVVVAPLIGKYECYISISDVSQQALFIAANNAADRFCIAGIFNSNWVVTNGIGVYQICGDIPAPINNAWYHVVMYYEFAGNQVRLIVNNIPSAVLGACVGGAAVDISNIFELSGFAALGHATPAAVYTIRYAAIDFNGIPDYVENRSERDLPKSSGNFSGAYNFSFGETVNGLDLILTQIETVTKPTITRFSIKVWLDELAFIAARAIAPDIIVNGGFEVSVAGWTAGLVPQYPQFVGVIAQDVFNFHTGAASMVIRPVVTGLGASTTDAIAVQPGQNYILSYWAHEAAGAGKQTIAAAVSFYDNTGVRQIGDTQILGDHVTTVGWVNHVDRFCVPGTAVFFRVHFMVRGAIFADIDVDDVTCFTCGLPRLMVQDVASGTWYLAGANYKGGGWYTLSTKINRTGAAIQVNMSTRLGHGWIVFDDARFD